MDVNKKSFTKKAFDRKLTTPLFGMLFCVIAAVGVIANIDTLVLSTWILFCVVVLFSDLKFFLKYIVYFFYYSTNVLAVYIIENRSFYLPELDCNTQRYGALMLVTLAHCVFLLILYYYDSSIEKRLMKKSAHTVIPITENVNTGRLIICSLFFTIICIYMLTMALKAPAAKVQLDRFMYAKQYINGLWRVMHTWAIYFIPTMVILAYRKKYITAFVPTFLFCFYMKLVGHKFGVFISVIAFFLPFIVERFRLEKWNLKNLIKLIPMALIAIIGFTKMLFSFMSKTYGSNRNEFYEYIYERLAQQGQMWWAIYGHEMDAGMHFDEFINSAGALYKIDKEIIANKDFGIYKLMKMVTPETIYNRKIENGSRYAFSTDASFYYYFKTAGLIILTIIFAIILLYITNWYWKEVKEQNWFGAIVSGYFYNTILSVLLQSDFNALFSRRAAFILIVYLIIDHNGIQMMRNIGVQGRVYQSS